MKLLALRGTASLKGGGRRGGTSRTTEERSSKHIRIQNLNMVIVLIEIGITLTLLGPALLIKRVLPIQTNLEQEYGLKSPQ